MALPEIIDARIEAAGHMASAKFRPRNFRQCIERQPDDDAVGRRTKQRPKLAFGRFQRRVRHVVDQADVDASRVRFTEFDPRLPVQTPSSRQYHGSDRLPTYRCHGRSLGGGSPARELPTELHTKFQPISCRFLERAKLRGLGTASCAQSYRPVKRSVT